MGDTGNQKGCATGLSLRGLSANWTRSNFGAGVSPPAAAAAGAVGSTGQRWADYDAAKAAEQALRQVLGVPNTDGSWSAGAAKHKPISGYHTPTSMMLDAGTDKENNLGGMAPPAPPAWASGLVSPSLAASALHSHRPSAPASGARTPTHTEFPRSTLGTDYLQRSMANSTMAPQPLHRGGAPPASIATPLTSSRMNHYIVHFPPSNAMKWATAVEITDMPQIPARRLQPHKTHP